MEDTHQSAAAGAPAYAGANAPARGPGGQGGSSDSLPPGADEAVPVIEQLFFAYRDFTGDPDARLEQIGFGRAHHRVLHFVCRHPGLRVADLLLILRITKQSLARVLKQLVEQGYVEQRSGESDRRLRHLHPTAKGEALFAELVAPQIARVNRALDEAGPAARPAVEAFLAAMCGEGTGQAQPSKGTSSEANARVPAST